MITRAKLLKIAMPPINDVKLSDVIREIEMIGGIAILVQPSPPEMECLNRALDVLEEMVTRLEEYEGPA